MTTNRRPLARHRHPSAFLPEILALFLELEHTPRRRRQSDAFKAKEKELMYALGLGAEFWSVTSALDRSTEPGCEPQYGRYQDWHTCREVRAQLLAASGREAPTRRRPRSRNHAPCS